MSKAGHKAARAKAARRSPSQVGARAQGEERAGHAQLTLWGTLVEPVVRLLRARRGPPQAPDSEAPDSEAPDSEAHTQPTAPTPVRRAVARATGSAACAKRGAGAKAELYERMTREMLATHGIRVRKWRTSMSGVAWYVTYRDGRVVKLIESPKPRSPMSAAIFLHEVGHHVLGIGAYKPRCLEEYHAWMYALDQMRRWGIEVTPRVERRVQRSLKYAVGKATRRGIREVPEELRRYA